MQDTTRSSVVDRVHDDAVQICSGLIGYDTTNFGGGVSRGERDAAEYVAGLLTDAGAEPVVVESAAGRANVLCRVAGSDADADGLLVHGHLDVVPVNAADWSVQPFSGEVRDGMVWGRGAIDMKSAIATTVAVVREWSRRGVRPRRDVVLAFVADEEDTGEYGAGYLVTEHADAFAGVTEAIGESGGSTVHLPDGQRLYPVGVAERGTLWMRLSASGTAGHGSRPTSDNAVSAIAGAVARIAGHQWPVQLTPPVRRLVDLLGELTDTPVDASDIDAHRVVLGRAARLIENVVRNTTSPTMLEAGYKVNVIPQEATAHVDGRVLPGREEEFLDTLRQLAGDRVEVSFVSRQSPVSAPFDSAVVEAMSDAVAAEDPAAFVVPTCSTGGTDAKWFSKLGIACYGFAPLFLAVDFDTRPLVHGVDERVPVEGLGFGSRVLDRFLLGC